MNATIKGRKIILGITGSIAAYKTCSLCRLLVKAGANVHILMTKAACQLVGAATFEALSGHSVGIDIFNTPDKISHISVVNNADLMVIAPASANTIAKLSTGIADNMLTAAALACTCKILIAPAMNTNMFHNQATTDNLQTLSRRGMVVMQPGNGDLACGVKADGRMPEPEEIFSLIVSLLNNNIPGHIGYTTDEMLPAPTDPLQLSANKLLPKASGAGLHVVVTAGPTVEDLDPVRFISNKSSGKMGFAIAKAARERGAEVTLIAGPVNLETPFGVKRLDVRSAVEMLQAVEREVTDSHIFISCAAVADFRAENIASQKISKRNDDDYLTLKLVKNPDIVSIIGHLEKNRPFTVGFAAETQNGEEHATAKLTRKNLNLIALNYVQHSGQGFNSDLNELRIYDHDGEVAHFPVQNKNILAGELMDLIFSAFKEKQE